jgi:hypothetical protein
MSSAQPGNATATARDADSRWIGRGACATLFWLLLVVVVVQGAAFLIAAGRGLDLTDESYYLLKYRYWLEWPTVSLFGAYFSVPYALFGHDVWAMRALGFVLLLGAGTWFGYEASLTFGALAGRTSREGLAAVAVASGAGLWNYYGAWPVPYTPSYNLLTLLCALLALALALRLGRALLDGQSGLVMNAVLLGVVGSVAIASKFSSGVLVLMLSLAVVGTLGWRRLDAGSLSRMALALAAGLALNVAILWLADPNLPTRVQRGVQETLAMVPRNPAHELAALATAELPKAVIASLRILLWPIVLAVFASAIGTLVSRRSLGDALAVAFLLVGALLDTYVKDNRTQRIVLATLVAILLALAALRVARKPIGTLARPRALLIAAVILVVPFAYSFGTNNQLLLHMGGAAIFPSVLAIAQIRVMWVERAIPTWVFAVGLALMTVLPAEFLVRQWIDGSYTYRLGAPLATQNAELPRNPGQIDLRVAPSMAQHIGEYLRLVRDSGFVPGQPMIDYTGQSPGLVALAGGVPLGAIWLIGGPTFNGNQTARISLGAVDPVELRRAWLLTSADSFASIDAWAEIMQSRIGALSHEEMGHVTIPDPTSDDKTKTIEVTLWRPKR